jgi:hypothetical protein
VPDDFWHEMRAERLVAPEAPLPIDTHMARATASAEIPDSAERVWERIGGFGSLPDWLPYIPKSELSEGGRVRRLTNPNGDTIIERLVAFDNEGRSYSYAIMQAPFPVTNYLSTLRVQGSNGGKTCRVEWTGSFTPKGVSKTDAAKLFQGIYDDGLKALSAGLASRN